MLLQICSAPSTSYPHCREKRAVGGGGGGKCLCCVAAFQVHRLMPLRKRDAFIFLRGMKSVRLLRRHGVTTATSPLSRSTRLF